MGKMKETLNTFTEQDHMHEEEEFNKQMGEIMREIDRQEKATIDKAYKDGLAVGAVCTLFLVIIFSFLFGG